MNNKVVNKQIPLETIVKVANHLEDYKENYDRKSVKFASNLALFLKNLPKMQRKKRKSALFR